MNPASGDLDQLAQFEATPPADPLLG
jgi:hypothetical protein